MDARGLWGYAVAEHAPPAPLRQVTGVGGGPVRAIPAAGLVAVVEDVPLAEFGELALRQHLEDLTWLERTARAHHQVVDAVAQHGPLVPLRLATVYTGAASVAGMLAERRAAFRAALDRISGRQEWGVKVYLRPDPGPAAATGRAGPAPETSGAGAAYLQRRRRELTAAKDTRRAALASAEAVHAELSTHAAGARLHPPQAPQLTAAREPMILNAAYLMDDERGAGFPAVLAGLAGQYPAIRLELTGPWPPYSFAALAEEGA
jgi:hypothetical protein